MPYIPFVFSGKIQFWLARHIVFWVVTYFGEASLLTLIPAVINRLGDNTVAEYFLVPVLYLPAQMLLTYTLLYYVIPRFVLHGKYKTALIATGVLVFISTAFAAFSYSSLVNIIRIHSFVFPGVPFGPGPLVERMQYGLVSGLQAVLRVAGFAAAIKLMKYWYENEYRNSILQREKLDAELKSLKAQLHPHFLFNTLNNIYSITENTSPLASDMLFKLSGLLRYILYECDRPLVDLSQEFKLIQDYISLEQVRYTNLDLVVRLPDDMDRYLIAPLLLLPLVENCFKHGTSKVLEQPWINIQAELKDDKLSLKLINGKPLRSKVESDKSGIGLDNLKKRLNLLYPGKHELAIISEEDIFVVNCKIELQNGIPHNG